MTAAKEKPVQKGIGIGTVQGTKKGAFGDPSAAQVLLHRALFGPRRQSGNCSFTKRLVTILVFGAYQGGRKSRFSSQSRRLCFVSKKLIFQNCEKRTRGAEGAPKGLTTTIGGTMVGVQGPREDPLDMIYQPEGQKEIRKLPKILTRHWA